MNTSYKTPSRDFVAVDVEFATRKEQSICQFGLAVVRDAQIVETRRWIIQPKNNFYDAITSNVHKMTAATTAKCPTLPDVWDEIASYLDGMELWAHNAASVEASILEKNLSAYAIPHKPYLIYDSRRLYIRPDREKWNKDNSLENCLYALGLPCENHHDAAEDAAMCAQIIIAVINGKEPDWELSDKTMEHVKEERGKFEAAQKVARQAQQLDLFSTALTSTALDCDHSRQHAPTLFEKTYNEGEDGVDPIDFNHLNTEESNPLYGCTVVVTGFFHVSRRQLLKALDAIGAKRCSSITKKTQVVLIGERNAGPKKLKDLTNLIHNGYNIARITGDEQLDQVLYDSSLTASDFAIPEPAKKELNFTVSHFRKHHHMLSYPVNTIATRELYFPPTGFMGSLDIFCQMCGNLGSFGNWDYNPQVNLVVLPNTSVEALQHNTKDDVIRGFETYYNSLRAVTFDVEFITERDILKFIRERIVRCDDDVTGKLYTLYLQSAGIDPEKDFKYGLAAARDTYEKEIEQQTKNEKS